MERPTYVTSMQHYLDEDHNTPESMPGPALNLALFLGSIVGWVTTHQQSPKPRTNVPCRRSPDHQRCTGMIHACFDDGSTIFWECPFCYDHGMIHGWEDTPWDRRRD
jgi:hypothetical protein